MKNVGDRTQSRISRRIPIRFGPIQPNMLGFVTNLSVGGVRISGKSIFRPGSFLSMLLEYDGQRIPLEGKVRWASDMKQQMYKAWHAMTMGVQFRKSNDQYVGVLDNLIECTKEVREEPRFEKVFRVSYEDPEKFFDEYTHNISLGGMFVVTDDPPAINSMVTVSIFLLDVLESVSAEVRVVQVVDETSAISVGMNPGFGAQFVRFFNGDQQKLEDYIASLKQRFAASLSA